ncbi:MAG: hypothetical protein LBU23_03225 [Planctomycetota bacterium]|nr:hypothetical protein [Planctomycetota bacterium]
MSNSESGAMPDVNAVDRDVGEPTPWLSVVAVSRNDDHGGDPLRRTQLFVDSLAWQAGAFSLPTELVLVEWNPPRDRPELADVLRFPVNFFFSVRIMTVPLELHAGLRHGDRLPLFQMIGKNVGIRRARGEFVLATNIDILLDDSLFARLAQRDLDPRRMYRADRYDIANSVTAGDHAAQQAFCRENGNQLRYYHRKRPPGYANLQKKDPAGSSSLLAGLSQFAWLEAAAADPRVVLAKPDMPVDWLHYYACGDFTLLHRDAWNAMRGYGEFEAFPMHIDSLGCIQAHLLGYSEASFLPPLTCYHIEHAPGSGWTPEHNEMLFDRLRKAAIPFIEWGWVSDFFVPLFEHDAHTLLNDERWGMNDLRLRETVFDARDGKKTTAADPITDAYRHPAALKPQFGLDVFNSAANKVWADQSEFSQLKNSTWRRLGLVCGLTRALRSEKRDGGVQFFRIPLLKSCFKDTKLWINLSIISNIVLLGLLLYRSF